MSEKLLLTIGMIFRNDIRCIERCLKALQPLREAVPCELLMTDTGSTDGSRQIAEQYADRILEFEWVDDFAAARNHGLKQARGKWFLFVDTDEYLQPDVSEIVAFLNSKKTQKANYASVVQRNYSTQEMLSGDYVDLNAIRMCRVVPGRFFEGIIHESWRMEMDEKPVALTNTILDHDGYTKECSLEKSKRNMALLEKKLEAEPENLRTISQALDAAYTVEQERKYAELLVRLIREKVLGWDVYGPGCLQNAFIRAYEKSFSEFKEWSGLAFELFPNSVFSYVDAAGYNALYHAEQTDYEECLKWCERFRQGWKRLQSDANTEMELIHGELSFQSVRRQEQLRMCEIVSLVELERYEEAFHKLSSFSIADCFEPERRIGVYLDYLLRIWTDSDLDCTLLLRKQWDAISSNEERRPAFLKAGWKHLRTDGEWKRRPAALLATLGEDCDLGCAAMLLETEDANEAERLLTIIDDWARLPLSVLFHAVVDLGAALPLGFYDAPFEELSSRANLLVKTADEQTLELLSVWVDSGFDQTEERIVWLYCLVCVMVSRWDWKEHPSKELAEYFRIITAAFLNALYTTEICQRAYVNLLPAFLRFGWYLIEAQKLLDDGKLTESVKMLRESLKAQPDMKDMVAFLTEQVNEAQKQRNAVSDELRALAEKLKLMLHTFPAGSAELEAIKASPVYQQVKHLIEE